MTDFRPVGEVLFAFASTDTDLKTGKVLEKTTTRDITPQSADPRRRSSKPWSRRPRAFLALHL